jgi:hypothetical protein
MAGGEKPDLVLKPKYVFSMILGRSVFFYFFGAAILSILGVGAASLAGGDSHYPPIAIGINSVWLVLYLFLAGPFTSGRYAMSSYRFYPDRVEYDAVKILTMENRSVVYDRVVETGRTKGFLQAGRGMGNIVLKVAATAMATGPQGTILQDNLVLSDIENVDENLEKVRRIISKK